MRNAVVILLTTCSMSVSAQSFVGIKGGLSFTNVSSSNFFEDTGSLKRFSGGFTYEYFLTEKRALGVDLIMNQRGFISELVFTDNQANPTGKKVAIDFTYTYLSLPIKTGLYFGQTFRAFSNIGVVPSVLTRAKTIVPAYTIDGVDDPGSTVDVTEQVNRFDFAGLLEIGGNYKATDKLWIVSSFICQYSFTTLTNANYFSESKVRHYGLTLSFGVKYRVSGD